MKNPLFAIVMSLLFLNCSSDDEIRENPYLPNQNVNVQLDLNLPQYDRLNFPGSHVILQHVGINGIVVYNMNNTLYSAFELTDPNHPIQDCSILQVEGAEAHCSCNDGNIYDIITGQQQAGEGGYSLKQYRTERYSNIIEISN